MEPAPTDAGGDLVPNVVDVPDPPTTHPPVLVVATSASTACHAPFSAEPCEHAVELCTEAAPSGAAALCGSVTLRLGELANSKLEIGTAGRRVLSDPEDISLAAAIPTAVSTACRTCRCRASFSTNRVPI